MERVLSPDERIRRAEEIYQRRKQSHYSNQTRVNVSNTKDYGLFRKMILQMIICLLIYVSFYLIKNSNYIFSEEFIKQAKEVLGYDINLTEKYEEVSTWLTNFGGQTNPGNAVSEIVPPIEDTSEENKQIEESQTPEETQAEGDNNTLSIAEDSSSISQTATDAEEIKAKYSLIKPLEGTITSRFGIRNPTTQTVPKYHTGIDIAANVGTVYRASMAGTVVQVSSEGDYRKPFEDCTR